MPSDVGMRLQTAFRRKLNMKKILYFLMFVFSTSVWAGGAEDNLLSIQSGYRALLQKQNNLDGKIIGMQSDLEDARRRLQAAQAGRRVWRRRCRSFFRRDRVGFGAGTRCPVPVRARKGAY